MRLSTCFFLIVMLVCRLMAGKCVAAPPYFINYQVEQGLSNNTILSIIQDKDGFIWAATIDGLNRFDGYTFKVFRPGNGRFDLKSAAIYGLAEDKQGVIWVGTRVGLYRYHKFDETFELIKATGNLEIREITFDKEGNVWFIVNHVPYCYSPQLNRLTGYSRQEHFVATGTLTTPDGTIWCAATDGHIRRFDNNTHSFVKYNLFPKSYKGDRELSLMGLLDSTRFLITTIGSQIKLFNTKTHQINTFDIPLKGFKMLYLRNSVRVSANEVWVAAEFGIYKLNINTGNISLLTKSYDDPYSLNDNSIHALYKDREGGIWVGTYNGGLNYCPKQFTPFDKYSPRLKQNAISGNVVRTIKQDSAGNLWIATEDNGLNKLNLKTGRFEHFLPNGRADAITYPNIHGLMASGNEVWIGFVENGMNVLDIRTGKVIRRYVKGARSGLRSNFIFTFFETSKGEKLAGTADGLYVYNEAKDRFYPYRNFPLNAWYAGIVEDDAGNIYAGTNRQGVFVLDAKTGKISKILKQHLPNIYINACFKDSRRWIWFATNGGLFRWEPQQKRLIELGAKNGFPSDDVVSIQEDDQHYLWLGTTKGLVRYQPLTGELEVYKKSNGLLSDQFNYNSSFKTQDGKLFFGSMHGMISFLPDSFKKDRSIPPIFVTSLEVNNKEVKKEDGTGILSQAITFEKQITLRYNQSTFSVTLAALTYTIPNSVRYAFKLDGLSTSWTYLGENRKVFFTQIPPGHYTLKVKVCNSFGYWGPEEQKLTITILPPWWQSNIAYLMYFLLGIITIIVIVRFYKQQLVLVHQRQMAEMQLVKEQEVTKSKIEFFTNLAHEIKTPLTLIKIPLRKVMRETKVLPQLNDSLNIISNNTERLISLTNQLLDFRETELSEYQLNLQRCDIKQLVNDAFDSFRELAKQKGLSFKRQLPKEAILSLIDIDAMQKVIYNLLSNAVKYAASSVEVTMNKLNDDAGGFELVFSNDGPLIPDEDTARIFEPFFRIKHKEKIEGNGLGLPLAKLLTELLGGQIFYSSINQQNVFTLKIPNRVEANGKLS